MSSGTRRTAKPAARSSGGRVKRPISSAEVLDDWTLGLTSVRLEVHGNALVITVHTRLGTPIASRLYKLLRAEKAARQNRLKWLSTP
jgi:hypothetical protein